MPMSPADAIELFRELLVELGSEEIAAQLNAEMQVKDLDMDSLELLEFLMLVDERSGVEISTDDAVYDARIGDLADIVSRKAA
ncbi:MAG: acyl carrier protein [Novosphingobium sp.]|nr:acyl carrier protein [Novosphingobium sp.]